MAYNEMDFVKLLALSNDGHMGDDDNLLVFTSEPIEEEFSDFPMLVISIKELTSWMGIPYTITKWQGLKVDASSRKRMRKI